MKGIFYQEYEWELFQSEIELKLSYCTIEALLRSHLAAFDVEKHTDVLYYGLQVGHLASALAKAKASLKGED